MTSTVLPPPGCNGLDMADGTRYNFQPGQRAQVSDEHASDIARSWYGSTGVIGGEQFTFGTRATRMCRACTPRRAWNAWSAHCPRCGAETTEETTR